MRCSTPSIATTATAIGDKVLEYLGQVHERAVKDVERYKELVEEAERLRQDLGAMIGLREVLSGEKGAKMFNIYPPDHMVWNYEREDTDDDLMSDQDRALLERLGG